MAAHDFTGRQKIFMSFRVIVSNTASLSAFPYEDTRVQGSANTRRMPEMIAKSDLDDLSRSITRTRSSCGSTANNEHGVDAFALNTLLAHLHNFFYLHQICRPMS